LFYYQPLCPASVAGLVAGDKAMYFVRSTSLPSSNFDEIVTSWQGFDFKAAGKRTFDTWNVSFNVDKQSLIRQAFLKWHNLILNPEVNKPTLPSVYQQDQTVTLLGFEGNDLLSYTLYAAYPSAIGEIALDYTNSDFAQFDVTFTYQYYTTNPSTSA
jgi:hypothetical protein